MGNKQENIVKADNKVKASVALTIAEIKGQLETAYNRTDRKCPWGEVTKKDVKRAAFIVSLPSATFKRAMAILKVTKSWEKLLRTAHELNRLGHPQLAESFYTRAHKLCDRLDDKAKIDWNEIDRMVNS